jgi:hypothetical protein
MLVLTTESVPSKISYKSFKTYLCKIPTVITETLIVYTRRNAYQNPSIQSLQSHDLFLILVISVGHLDALLRSLVIRFLGKCGDDETVTEAKKRFDQHAKGESSLPADLRSPVYSIVLAHGDHDTLGTVKDLYRKAELQEEKIRLLTSMGSVKETELIKDVLNFSLSVSLERFSIALQETADGT